jgi:hypothetical protein
MAGPHLNMPHQAETILVLLVASLSRSASRRPAALDRVIISIDGGLSPDSCRLGRMPVTAALGQGPTFCNAEKEQASRCLRGSTLSLPEVDAVHPISKRVDLSDFGEEPQPYLPSRMAINS